MKRLIVLSILLMNHIAALACQVCERQQPKALRGITHGAGPQSEWDYVIVVTISMIVIVSFTYALKWLIKPGERNTDHIKNIILSDSHE